MEIDAEVLFKSKGMSIQAYMFRHAGSLLFACERNTDGWFELVRLDRSGDGKEFIEMKSAGPGKPYQSRQVAPGSTP